MNETEFVLVFDMDDTLYVELDFVYGGFRAVAELLYFEHNISQEDSFNFMQREEKKGRGHIFDALLKAYGVFSKKMLKSCLMEYRSHNPLIKLLPDAETCLERLAAYPLYLVTDGNKYVQNNKIRALGLEKRMKFCYITHRYGLKSAKPSTYCFEKICRRENIESDRVIYIGDNPNKDFVGIKACGYKTVRVMRGNYREINRSVEYEADSRVESLDELTKDFLHTLCGVNLQK